MRVRFEGQYPSVLAGGDRSFFNEDGGEVG